ncbi:hypothetical protein [Paraburkholderia lycopersici]|nr:hypothetical protein [Paraburkholderia lycopersici]
MSAGSPMTCRALVAFRESLPPSTIDKVLRRQLRDGEIAKAGKKTQV